MPPVRNGLLFLALVAGVIAVYLEQERFLEVSRPLTALAVLGFVLAGPSERKLRAWIWATLLAVDLWLAQSWASQQRGVWLACAVAGAALAVRAGSRGMGYLLPEANNEHGLELQARIRLQLVAAVVFFAAAYVWDGGLASHAPPAPRAFLLFLSAVFFTRYLLLQSTYLGIGVRPLGGAGLVYSQRWPCLVVAFVLVATPYPALWLGSYGEGPLLLSAVLFFLLAGLLYALALARSGWPKRDVRKMSFVAGIGLAFVLASVVAELQRATPERFTFFGALAVAFLLVAPFVRATTRLFDAAPLAKVSMAPTYLAVMSAPVAAASAFWRVSASRGFLLALAVLVTIYYVTVGLRNERRDVAYPLASLGCVVAGSFVPVSGAWEVFALSLCFALYAVDFRQRVVDSSGH